MSYHAKHPTCERVQIHPGKALHTPNDAAARKIEASPRAVGLRDSKLAHIIHQSILTLALLRRGNDLIASSHSFNLGIRSIQSSAISHQVIIASSLNLADGIQDNLIMVPDDR